MPDSNIHSSALPSTETCSIKHVVISKEELSELPRSTYECDLCGLQVKTKANLRAHHVKTHRILKNDSDLAFYTKQKNTVSYVYHCPVAQCKHNIEGGGGFASCSRLKQHYQNVHMSKTYACPRCEQRFSTPTAQAYHMRLCGNVYICSVCSKAYSIKKNLTQHFRRSGHHPGNRVNTRERATSQRKVFPISTGFRGSSETAAQLPQTEVNLSQPQQQSVWVPFFVLPIPVPQMNNDLNTGGMGVFKLPSSDSIATPFLTGPVVSGPFLSNAKNANSDLTTSKPTQLVSQACCTSPLVECSTQTELVDVAVDATNPCQNTSSVSVNIGTDEDDISAFIGSLFCDASVETELPAIELVHEFTDTGLDSLGCLERADPIAIPQYEQIGFDTSDLRCVQPTLDYTESRSPAIPVDAGDKIDCQTADFQSFSLSLLNSMENTEKDSVSVDTKEPPTDCQMYFSSNRPLETPPPLRSQTNTQSMSICRPRLLSNLQSKQSMPNTLCLSSTVASSSLPGSPITTTLSATLDEDRSSFYSRCHSFSESSNLYTHELDMKQTGAMDPSTKPQQPGYNLHSLQSIGLQSSPWSPAPPVYASMETQTMDADLESWLNNVQTQTSISTFDLHTFSEMGVGVDEDFLTAALNSFEAEEKFSNVCDLVSD